MYPSSFQDVFSDSFKFEKMLGVGVRYYSSCHCSLLHFCHVFIARRCPEIVTCSKMGVATNGVALNGRGPSKSPQSVVAGTAPAGHGKVREFCFSFFVATMKRLI